MYIYDVGVMIACVGVMPAGVGEMLFCWGDISSCTCRYFDVCLCLNVMCVSVSQLVCV